jgi:peptidoglycan DL-endopeptidase CwlO
MEGLSAVQSRIAAIQTRLATVSQPQLVTAGGTSATSGSSSFAAALAALTPAGSSGTGLATAAGPATGTPAASAAGATAAGATAGSGPDGSDLVAAARKYLGVPYRWGGTDPATGLDCSALVQRAFADLGVKVPRVVADQKSVGTEVASLADARPGDLIVLGRSRHIGIYVGEGKMLHAPRTGDVVKIGKVYEEPTTIRRVLDPASATGTGTAATATTSTDAAAALRPAALAGTGATRYAGLFSAATQRYDLPAGLLSAVAKVESGYNASAVSPAGAGGLMQLMPGTARELGVDRFDPAQAVDGAARLLRDHLRTFGSLPLALAAYNAGPGAVRRHDGIPPYKETQNYVRKVSALLGAAA